MSTILTMSMQLFAYDPQAQPVNYTGSDGMTAEMKTFYDDLLIDTAGPNLVHEQFGQKRPIPKNKGKTIEFRKYSPLAKAITPLTEGVTPDGKKLVVTAITATVDQYGDFVPLTDMIELTTVDNNVVEATKLLGKQAGLTMDTVVRDAINTGTNVSYASSFSGSTETTHSTRYSLTADSKLTVLEVQKAVRKLKRKNAPKMSDGNYVAIIHPDVAFDIMRDPEWVEAHKYAQPDEIYKGEIGKIAGCRFVESTEAKIFCGADLSETSRTLTTSGAVSAAKAIGVTQTLVAGALVGRYVIIGTGKYKITANTTNQITVDENVTASSGATIYPGEGGADGIAVYSCLFLGSDAYGVTDVTGGGLETIVKPLGSGDDPLNQRSTVGWKGIKVAEILTEDYMVRLEVGSSSSATAEAN